MSIRIFFLLACFFFLSTRAEAHKIHVFSWVSGDTVTVESNFSSKRPLIHGSVTVKDGTSGAVLLEGTGDAKGIFTFTVPAEAKAKKADLLIVVSGGEGHQNEWLIPAAEYLSEQSSPSPITPAATHLNNAELQEMIREIIAQELAPIKRSLAENRKNKPGFRDIMGGIGYLLGLTGLVAWLKNRQPREPRN